MIDEWTKAGEAKSVGLLGNAAEVLPELVRRAAVPRPDIVTDQTSAHDPLNGYLPKGWTWPSGGRSVKAIRRRSKRPRAPR